MTVSKLFVSCLIPTSRLAYIDFVMLYCIVVQTFSKICYGKNHLCVVICEQRVNYCKLTFSILDIWRSSLLAITAHVQ